MKKNILLLITQSSLHAQEEKKVLEYIKNHQLEEYIELLGYLDFDDLPKYYSMADISLYTGIGSGASCASLFVLECMSCETPGIRTNHTIDEIEHNVSGFLFEPHDNQVLDKYVVELLNNDSLRKLFAKAARQKILKQYSWESVTKRIQQAIESTDKALIKHR